MLKFLPARFVNTVKRDGLVKAHIPDMDYDQLCRQACLAEKYEDALAHGIVKPFSGHIVACPGFSLWENSVSYRVQFDAAVETPQQNIYHADTEMMKSFLGRPQIESVLEKQYRSFDRVIEGLPGHPLPVHGGLSIRSHGPTSQVHIHAMTLKGHALPLAKDLKAQMNQIYR